MKASPIQEKDRIVVLDIIRGFAILGIFLVNMPSFFSPVLYIDPQTYWGEPLDKWTLNAIDILAQASFYTLFSFLFGYGFIIFINRLKEKDLSVPKYFSRRLVVLLFIGCIHAFFIWHGDILITYALIGFLLLGLRNISVKAMVWTGLLLIIIPTIFLSLSLILLMMMGMAEDLYAGLQVYALQSLEVYANGTFLEITRQRLEDWSFVNVDNFIFIVFSILPMFLFGAAAAKQNWLNKVEEKLGLFKKLWAATFFLTLVFKLLPYYYEQNFVTEYVQDSLGGSVSAIFYFLSIVLLSRKKIWFKIMEPLRYIGQMSLTNYLFQSILCTYIFYSYGFGQYGNFSPFYGLLLVLGIYPLQIVLSRLWLQKFKYGPVEWLWRAGTYGARSPLKRLQ